METEIQPLIGVKDNVRDSNDLWEKHDTIVKRSKRLVLYFMAIGCIASFFATSRRTIWVLYSRDFEDSSGTHKFLSQNFCLFVLIFHLTKTVKKKRT